MNHGLHAGLRITELRNHGGSGCEIEEIRLDGLPECVNLRDFGRYGHLCPSPPFTLQAANGYRRGVGHHCQCARLDGRSPEPRDPGAGGGGRQDRAARRRR
ncbi:hypothetical protein D1872_303490 [compost metagenome]